MLNETHIKNATNAKKRLILNDFIDKAINDKSYISMEIWFNDGLISIEIYDRLTKQSVITYFEE
jgi:hypothetical protein